jgi:hypothetical protein
MRSVAFALLLAVLLAAPGAAQSPNAPGNGDVFSTNPGGLPGEPQIGRYGTDPECGGTNRVFYDQMYHTQGVVMSVPQMQQHYRQGEIQRCGDCSKSGPDRVICWLKAGITSGNPGDIFNTNPGQQIPPPANTNPTGPQPPPGNNFGKVCPPTMSPQQAAAQGCRFLGSVTGYDICANPNANRYPQCAETTTPGRGPSDYQVWLGVTMPTQNCQQYNAAHPGHQYDCSVWCKSFGRDTAAPGQPAKYPPICAPYVQPKPAPQQTACEAEPPASAYASGFVQGFASCLGGVFYGPVVAISRDFSDFGRITQALWDGDPDTAGQILAIKGDRNRQEFDAFIKSLNPKVIGAAPHDAGFRDGSRLCQFGVVPGVTRSLWGKTLPPTTPSLPRSGLALQRVQLNGASALKPINAKGGTGYAFEIWREGNLPANFKTIDRVPAQELASALENGGVLTNPSEITSIKTLSATPSSPTYASAGAIRSTLMRYSSQLKNFQPYCKRGLTVSPGPNTKLIMEVGIPDTATAQQLAELDEAALSMRQQGIELRVFQLSGVEGW